MQPDNSLTAKLYVNCAEKHIISSAENASVLELSVLNFKS